MSQPKWKLIGNLGDVNFITYGGFLVYVDETGVYAPEAECIDAPEDGTWTIHRIILDRCTHVNGELSDNKYHPECAAWFADSLKSVASYCDQTVESLIADLCDADPLKRAWAYKAIGDYHGFGNFDSYPLTLTQDEINARYNN